MKKLYLIVFIGLLFSWSGIALGQMDVLKHDFSESQSRLDFLKSIEAGDLNWESFVNAIKDRQIRFEEVSPSAVANYLEAFANEGLMEFIPYRYFSDEELKTSLSVVFEDPSNICKNKKVYVDQME